eukprot:365342-Chlamydomonas_euryale.AAC.2
MKDQASRRACVGIRRSLLVELPHSVWHVDRLGGAGRRIVGPPVDIARYPAEHDEVLDCTQTRDRGHIGEDDLVYVVLYVVLSLERIQRRAPVHYASADVELLLKDGFGPQRCLSQPLWRPRPRGVRVALRAAQRPEASDHAGQRGGGGGQLGHWVVARHQLPGRLAGRSMAGAGRSLLASAHQPELVHGYKEEGQGRVPCRASPAEATRKQSAPIGVPSPAPRH